jgi:single-stranded DNA-binding protein
MPITTHQSISGFIASNPTLSITERGDSRVRMRFGQPHFDHNEDGTFTEREATFHDLVIYRTTGEKAQLQFRKGDRFVAEGYVHAFETKGPEGQVVQREEFVARKIGHDINLTDYKVDRTRRGPQVTAPTQSGPAPAPVSTIPAMGL